MKVLIFQYTQRLNIDNLCKKNSFTSAFANEVMNFCILSILILLINKTQKIQLK